VSRRGRGVAVVVGSLVLVAAAQGAFAATGEQDMVARGRYLSQIAGCNDCHTAGYLLSEGKVPEAQWLTGDSFGWRGPWGTTYAPNLRLFMANLTEDEWLVTAKNLKTRPPMPWYTVNMMEDRDLRAIYQYVRHLGPAGKEAPAYVPPDQVPPPPYAQFPSPPPKK
jgi:mono/diheme cytochrome c family protein